MKINFTPSYNAYNQMSKRLAFGDNDDNSWFIDERERIIASYTKKKEYLDDLVDAGFINEDTYFEKLDKLDESKKTSLEYLDKRVEDYDRSACSLAKSSLNLEA